MEEIIIYQPHTENCVVKVKIKGENVWLNRQQLDSLFDRDLKTIGKHVILLPL